MGVELFLHVAAALTWYLHLELREIKLLEYTV